MYLCPYITLHCLSSVIKINCKLYVRLAIPYLKNYGEIIYWILSVCRSCPPWNKKKIQSSSLLLYMFNEFGTNYYVTTCETGQDWWLRGRNEADQYWSHPYCKYQMLLQSNEASVIPLLKRTKFSINGLFCSHHAFIFDFSLVRSIQKICNNASRLNVCFYLLLIRIYHVISLTWKNTTKILRVIFN